MTDLERRRQGLAPWLRTKPAWVVRLTVLICGPFLLLGTAVTAGESAILEVWDELRDVWRRA